MTNFYAYFSLTGTITHRVGASCEADALTFIPEPATLLAEVTGRRGRDRAVRDISVERINLLPHYEAEEHADHAFMELPSAPAITFSPARQPGVQYLWDVDIQLTARGGHIIDAPTTTLARQRADEALAHIETHGFSAIEAQDAPEIAVEALSARRWVPAGLRLTATEEAR